MPDGTTPQGPRTYAGKYQSPEALESGYNELFRLSQKTSAERKALEERNRLLETMLAQRAQTQEREPDEDPYAGMSADDLDRRIDQRAVERTQQILDPLLKAAEAASYFGSDQSAISQFLSDTPEIQTTFQSMVSANPEGAARYVKLEYQRHLAENRESDVQSASREAREERAAARQSAALPANRGAGRVEPNPAADHDARLEKTWEKARETGDATAWVKERLVNGAKIQAWWPEEPPPDVYLKAQQEGRI